MDKCEIGARILENRKKQGLTQKDLADKLHVSDKAVSKWETGVHYPDIAMIEELASALAISTQELLGLENASSEETIKSMVTISVEEKKPIIRDIRMRGVVSAVCGLGLWAGVIYISYTLFSNCIMGLPYRILPTMMVMAALTTANGIVSFVRLRRILK